MERMGIVTVTTFVFTFLLTLVCSTDGQLATAVKISTSRVGTAKDSNTCQRVRQVPPDVRKTLRLDKFYEKYTEAYGIPVIASKKVSDDALQRACYVLRFLLADNPAVRQSFYSNAGRVAVIGQEEGTTSIPEHSHLEPWWNQRTRGLGAKKEIPVCSGGEKNILCHKYDIYYRDDILLHTIAHGVHILGADDAIDGWQDRLRKQYEVKVKAHHTHSKRLSSKEEYFAEGVENYFNGNHQSDRKTLEREDPTLFKLIREVFPCGNQYLSRCNSSRALEDTQPLMMNCYRKVTTEKVTTEKVTTPIPPTKTDCFDSLKVCPFWSRQGSCKSIKHGRYIRGRCQKSCGLCKTATTVTVKPVTVMTTVTTVTDIKTDCEDNARECPYYKTLENGNYCSIHSEHMAKLCRKTCGFCQRGTSTVTTIPTRVTSSPVCVDNDSKCPGWSKQGHCNSAKYGRYMKWHCQKSCGMCKTATTATVKPVTAMTTAKVIKTDCSDSDSKCPGWSKQGHCNSRMYGQYMRWHCRKSCGWCKTATWTTYKPATTVKAIKTDCSDRNSQCPAWAAGGHCGSNPQYMKSYCVKSCGLCQTSTKDKKERPKGCYSRYKPHYQCQGLRANGGCHRKPDYMKCYCPGICRFG